MKATATGNGGSMMSGVTTNRRTVLRGFAAGAVASALAVPAAHARQAATGELTAQQVYFGWLLGSTNLVAAAFDVKLSATAGSCDVLGYVCDGLGLPAGQAVWFKDTVELAAIEPKGSIVTLTSPSGAETLTIGVLSPSAVTGTYTGADGVTYRYASFIATGGAGIYDVTLDASLHYAGTSTDGHVLAADADLSGTVVGSITTAGGEEIAFNITALALTEPATLEALGLPTAFTDYAANSVQPDSYVALISPGGYFWLGRSGDVRTGDPGTNIIGLDACD